MRKVDILRLHAVQSGSLACACLLDYKNILKEVFNCLLDVEGVEDSDQIKDPTIYGEAEKVKFLIDQIETGADQLNDLLNKLTELRA